MVRRFCPVLVHGDAAFGARASTRKRWRCRTRGYSTGGTVHLIIINNQIGFTTSDPRDAAPRCIAPTLSR